MGVWFLIIRFLITGIGSLIGGLAQLGEHLLCKQGVIGSIPIASTKLCCASFGGGYRVLVLLVLALDSAASERGASTKFGSACLGQFDRTPSAFRVGSSAG